jgi:hypothetical protein
MIDKRFDIDMSAWNTARSIIDTPFGGQSDSTIYI